MEPEHLQVDGARFGRPRTWMVLGVALLLVVGLVVLRLTGSTPDTAPGPVPTPVGTATATATATATSGAWPSDLPAGTLFAAAAGQVWTIDTVSGTPTRMTAQAEPVGTSLTGLAGGVLVWRAGSRDRQVLLADGLSLRPVRGALRPDRAAAFLPGPGGAVWAAGVRRSTSTTWRRVDVDGRASTSVRVEGSAASDGAGGLLSVDGQGVRPAYPLPRRPRRAGAVIATGPAGYVVRACGSTGCRFTLHHRDGAPDTDLETAVGDDTSAGALSPTNRLLAVTERVGGTSTIRVSVVGTGQIKEIFPSPRGSTDDAVWLDDRWLALISEDQLVLYDTTTDRVFAPAVLLGDVGPLAWRPA